MNLEFRIMKEKPMKTKKKESGKGFIIRCHYRMADLESTKVFPTREAAVAELRRWKRHNTMAGYRMVGSVRAKV